MRPIELIATILVIIGVAVGAYYVSRYINTPYRKPIGITQQMVKLKYSGDSALHTTVQTEYYLHHLYAIRNAKMPIGFYPPDAWYVPEITDSVKRAHYKLAERLQ